ncbi:hypothetical protein NDU88_001474 [Pleurodeles waltl]|uniref:Uncharacterized protein n=1 Tax=Pleurodeles waltl TaxID=8319 RepID=A0AAV7KRK5_PLEWA|nr:hypothetical protein NDU88_001474 [Pleurodeles waltl]
MDRGRPCQGPLTPPEATTGLQASEVRGQPEVSGETVVGAGASPARGPTRSPPPQSQRIPDLFCGGDASSFGSAGAGRWSPGALWCPSVPPQSWGWLTPRLPGLVLHHPFPLSGQNYCVPPGRPVGVRGPQWPIQYDNTAPDRRHRVGPARSPPRSTAGQPDQLRPPSSVTPHRPGPQALGPTLSVLDGERGALPVSGDAARPWVEVRPREPQSDEGQPARDPPGPVAAFRWAAGSRASPRLRWCGARSLLLRLAVLAHLCRDTSVGSKRPVVRSIAGHVRGRTRRALGPFTALRIPQASQLTAHRRPPSPGHLRQSIQLGNRTQKGSKFGRLTEVSRALSECDRHLDARSHAKVSVVTADFGFYGAPVQPSIYATLSNVNIPSVILVRLRDHEDAVASVDDVMLWTYGAITEAEWPTAMLNDEVLKQVVEMIRQATRK